MVNSLAEVERLTLIGDGNHSWAEWLKEREENGASGLISQLTVDSVTCCLRSFQDRPPTVTQPFLLWDAFAGHCVTTEREPRTGSDPRRDPRSALVPITCCSSETLL